MKLARLSPGCCAIFLILLWASAVCAGLVWDESPSIVATDVADAAGVESPKEVFQLHVSPGGTVFFVWRDFSGHLSDSTLSDDLLRCCDGRMAFTDPCPSYDSLEYGGCEENPPPPAPPCISCDDPIACRYYYLPKYLGAIYVQALAPDGVFGAVETVTPFDPDSITAPDQYDAAMGPDGSLHVTWIEVVPNVPIDPAPYSNTLTFATQLPLAGQAQIYNRCGFDEFIDGRPDSVNWVVGPDSATCVDSCNQECDEIRSDVTTCQMSVPCWRQLAQLKVVCYRRRGPTGTWGPVHRNIAPWTDLNAPDTLRTCKTPVIAVDAAGWVYIAFEQKPVYYPDCAWRSTKNPAFAQAAKTSRGPFNTGQFDCFLRKWNSAINADGPTAADSTIRVTFDAYADSMPTGYTAHANFQGDAPWDILVEGSGETSRVHLIVARAPTIGDPCPGTEGFYQDCDLYTVSDDGGHTWSDRKLLARSLKQMYACGDSCDPQASILGSIEMRLAHFAKNAYDPVHVVYDHEFRKLSANCPNCPRDNSCFPNYSFEVFHRVLPSEDAESWEPPFSQFGNRVAVFGQDDPAEDVEDTVPVAVSAANGSLHVFWRRGANRIMHSELGASWSTPDTVVAFTSGTAPLIGCFDVVEQNGIFHLFVGERPDSVAGFAPDSEELPHPNAQGTTLYYKRGMLAPDDPDTVICSESPGTWDGYTCTWADTITLCENFEVLPCSTLVVLAGTVVRIAPRESEVDPPVELTVRGKLICAGTAEEPIIFRSTRSPERATVGDWQGVHLKGSSARARLAFTRISGAIEGIRDVNATTAEPSSCTSGDSIPAAVLEIENCEFRYNQIAGVYVKGNNATNTPDLLRVDTSLFQSNLKGLIVENVSVPDTGGFAIRRNRFLYNDWVGIEVRGKFNRTVVIDSNLVQGLGPDEFINSFDEPTYADIGMLYDEGADGANGDRLIVSNNTFYRTEGAGFQVNLLPDLLTGYTKTQVGVGDTTGLFDNLFYRTGVGMAFADARSNVFVRRNVLIHYGVGVWTSNGKIDLGSAEFGDGGNFFDSTGCGGAETCYGDATSPPLFSGYHIVRTDTATTVTLRARGNVWKPVNPPGAYLSCYATDYFSGPSIDNAWCLNGALVDAGYPEEADHWSVFQMPLKRAPNARPATPSVFALHSNQPNPLRKETRIRFDLPRRSEVHLSVFDVQGREVRRLISESMPAGSHEITWNGDDDRGRETVSGIYFYRMRAGAFEETRKMTLIR